MAREHCERARSIRTGIGETIYAAADRGQLRLAQAKLLLQILLTAGADTTVITMANAMRAWADEFPADQSRCVPTRSVRAAFDEFLRWDALSRMAGRLAMRDVEIEGFVIPAAPAAG